ncbi:MAG: hypothetical protein A2506_09075 [Elusimicrobia bacterium RIFOXYD12_FULL_66_9]|nr:MAG: hypothetical protein A2506_09075 [Elusimicrobia bacterium RIFOXYD12_FULL_66_9]
MLRKGQFLRFHLQLTEGQSMGGRGRVVWVERTDLALWAGVEFIGLSWSDRRRLRRITRPSEVAWSRIFDKAIKAALFLTATLLIWGAVTSYVWRALLWNMAPKVLATLALGWALREIIRPRR